ncbi:MAG: trypsin-like peptidase domain-containing protein [Alphaproteobacteria bacterium]
MRRCYPAIALLAAVLAVISTIAPSVGAEPGFATPGQDEVLVLESENLQAFVRLGRKGDWCRQKANLNLYMRDDTVFGGDQRELKALLAELPDVLRSECSMLRNVGIRGFIAGKRIYRANINAINATPRTIEKILDRRIAAKYSGPVAPRAETVEATEDQPLREETGRLFTMARNLGEQCDMLAAWTTRFFDEYPGFDVFANDVGEFEPRAANLFGDRLFVPLFGRPYDETEPAWRGQLFQQVYQRCPKKYRFTPGIGAVFKGGFSSYAARLNSETLLVKVKERREIRAWLERQLAELDGIPVSAAGLERVHELATDGPARISVLWPSEQTAFTSRVVARRSQLALRLADERIAALPVDGESLRSIGTILGATESYVIAADDASFATLRARAEARREEIRVGLVEREITALAAYPDEVLSLAQISAQAQRLLETVGRTPPLPVIERYELARASRGVEIARAALPAFEAELALLPESFSGAEAAIAQFQSISDLLVSVVPAWAPIFEAAARERTRLIHDFLIDAAVARVSAAAERSSDEGWRVAPRLLAIGADEASPFAGTLAKDRAVEIISATAVWEANAVAEQEIGRFRDEVSALDATWASVNELDRMAVLIRQHEQAIPPLEGYGAEAADRRAHVLDALAEMARGKIQTAGASYLDAEDILTLGERYARKGDTLIKPFAELGLTARVAALRDATRQRVTDLLRSSLPAYEAEIAGFAPGYDVVDGLQESAKDFDSAAQDTAVYTAYAAAARIRADQMLEALCNRALETAGLALPLSEAPVLVASKVVPARQFVCDLNRLGHSVREFASPGSIANGQDVTFKIAQKDGGPFDFATLKRVEAVPSQMALVGAMLGDALNLAATDLKSWDAYTKVLMGQPTATNLAQSGPRAVFEKLRQSTVWLIIPQGRGPCPNNPQRECASAGFGTGSFIAPNLIMTNAHVIEGKDREGRYSGTNHQRGYAISQEIGVKSFRLLVNARRDTAAKIDAAILEIPDFEHDAFLTLAETFTEFEWIATAGHPGVAGDLDANHQSTSNAVLFGRTANPDYLPSPVVVDGMINNIVLDADTRAQNLLYTMETAPGASGSPVVNACGQLVGLHFAGSSERGAKYNVGVTGPNVEAFLRLAGIPFTKAQEPCDIVR